MVFSFNSARDTAVSIAAALITGLLFISAAVGPLSIA